MTKKSYALSFSLATLMLITGFFALSAPSAQAFGCASAYPQSRSANGLVTKTYNLLNTACEAKSSVAGKVVKNNVVRITARAYPWYQVIAPDGSVGWIPIAYMKVTSKKLTNPSSVTDAHANKDASAAPAGNDMKASKGTLMKMKGRILIPLEDTSRAYYFDPRDGKLNLFITVDDMGAMLKAHSEGAIQKGYFVKNGLGQIAYVHPDTGKTIRIDINSKGLALLRSYAIQLPGASLKDIDPSIDLGATTSAGPVSSSSAGSSWAPTLPNEEAPGLPQ